MTEDCYKLTRAQVDIIADLILWDAKRNLLTRTAWAENRCLAIHDMLETLQPDEWTRLYDSNMLKMGLKQLHQKANPGSSDEAIM